MADRIDHAAEARKAIESAYPIALPYDSAEAQYHGALMEAQVHATLALVEQQRIANLLSYVRGLDAQLNLADEHPGAFDEVTRPAALERHSAVQRQIREWLAL